MASCSSVGRGGCLARLPATSVRSTVRARARSVFRWLNLGRVPFFVEFPLDNDGPTSAADPVRTSPRNGGPQLCIGVAHDSVKIDPSCGHRSRDLQYLHHGLLFRLPNAVVARHCSLGRSRLLALPLLSPHEACGAHRTKSAAGPSSYRTTTLTL